VGKFLYAQHAILPKQWSKGYANVRERTAEDGELAGTSLLE
jgi:hypothetical protein